MRKFLLLFCTVYILINLTGCTLKENKRENKILEDIVELNGYRSAPMTDRWYYFRDDMIYGYVDWGQGFSKYKTDNGGIFFKCDLSGKNVEIIHQEKDMISNARIYLETDEYAYYYTPYDNSFKRINLVNGEIETVADRCLTVIPETLSGETIEVCSENTASGYGYFANLNINTFELTNEKIITIPSYSSIEYYCVDNDKVYSIESDGENQNGEKIYRIYEDNEEIYKYFDSINDKKFHKTVFTQDGYIFAIVNKKIVKVDMENKLLVEEKNVDNYFSLIPSNTEGAAMILGEYEHALQICATKKPLFIGDDGAIYKFNSDVLEFEEVIAKRENMYNLYAVDYGDFFVIQGEKTTTILDKITGNYKTFDSLHFSIDDGYLYIMGYEGDFHQTLPYMNYKVEKYKIDECI